MAIAAPTKSAAWYNVASGESRPGTLSNQGASRIASPIGAGIPAMDTAAALVALAVTLPPCWPRPTNNILGPPPRGALSDEGVWVDGGNTLCGISGPSSPNRL